MNQEANGVLIFLPYIVFTMNKWIRCRHHSHFNLRFVFIQLVVIVGLAEKEKKTCIRNSFRSSLKRGFCLNIHSVSANQKKCPLTSNMCVLLVLIQKWSFIFPSKKSTFINNLCGCYSQISPDNLIDKKTYFSWICEPLIVSNNSCKRLDIFSVWTCSFSTLSHEAPLRDCHFGKSYLRRELLWPRP